MVEIGGREKAKREWGAGEEDNSMAVLTASKYLIVHNILCPNNSTRINPQWKPGKRKKGDFKFQLSQFRGFWKRV
jgi:hypothetical protein